MAIEKDNAILAAISPLTHKEGGEKIREEEVHERVVPVITLIFLNVTKQLNDQCGWLGRAHKWET